MIDWASLMAPSHHRRQREEEPRPGPPAHHSLEPRSSRGCVSKLMTWNSNRLATRQPASERCVGRLTGRRLVADTQLTFNHIADAPRDEATLLPTRSAQRDWSRMPREGFRPHASTARTNCCICMQQQHHHHHHHWKRRQTPAQQRVEGFQTRQCCQSEGARDLTVDVRGDGSALLQRSDEKNKSSSRGSPRRIRDR